MPGFEVLDAVVNRGLLPDKGKTEPSNTVIKRSVIIRTASGDFVDGTLSRAM